MIDGDPRPLGYRATVWTAPLLSQYLRDHHGIEVSDADKIAKQLKYAASRGVRFVIIQGEDERARGEAAIKDLQSGEQTSVPRAGAAAFIRSRLNG